jgi:hypothetical protein
MKRWTRAGLLIFVVAVLCTLQTPARADDDDQKKMNITVAFGRGLNTNQAGNLVNHVILPNNIEVNHRCSYASSHETTRFSLPNCCRRTCRNPANFSG